MAKKVVNDAQKVQNSVETENVEQKTVVEQEVKEDKSNKKQKEDKSVKNSKVNKKATKKEKKSLGKKIKESASELKKVSWPTFGKTVKQTGMVIGVVFVCTLVLFGIESLLAWLHGLLF